MVYVLPEPVFFAAPDWAREENEPAGTLPPLAFAVDDWMREAAAGVIGDFVALLMVFPLQMLR